MQKDSEYPAPFFEADLRGLEWMPLLGDRLFESDTWLMASDRERVVALRLWWASWKQNPAGSLPAADRALCQLAGCGDMMDAWLAVKAVAMRGWIKCSDGRLYHPIVCEQAEITYERLQLATAKASGNTARKHREREERRELFAKLRDAGCVLPFNTPMKILREQVAMIVTAPVTASSPAQRDTVASMPDSPAIMPHDSPGEAPVTASSTAHGEHVTAYEKTVTGSVTSNTGKDRTGPDNNSEPKGSGATAPQATEAGNLVPNPERGAANQVSPPATSQAPEGPLDYRTLAWRDGKRVVRGLTGVSDTEAGKIVGRLAATIKNDFAALCAILQEAERIKPLDAVAWLTAAAQERAAPGTRTAKKNAFGDAPLTLEEQVCLAVLQGRAPQQSAPYAGNTIEGALA